MILHGDFQVAEMAEMRRDRECSTSHASGLILRCGDGLVGDFVVLSRQLNLESFDHCFSLFV